jgi:hypothetical protein
MNAARPSVLVTLLLGLLAAGPVAALAIVAVPGTWRGPLVPATILVCTVLVTAAVRHRPRGGSPPP